VHRVLRRQLSKIGIDTAAGPSRLEQWQAIVERVDRSYQQADQDRYTLERSLTLSAQEIQDLYRRQHESSESRLRAERDKLRSANAHLQALYEGSPDMIFLHGQDGRLLVDRIERSLESFLRQGHKGAVLFNLKFLAKTLHLSV